MIKKWYKITFNAELTADDVRAMNKCFYDIMNEAMDIYDLADLELKPNDDAYEITFSAKLTTDDAKAMNGCFFSAMWEEMGIECYNLEIEKE